MIGADPGSGASTETGVGSAPAISGQPAVTDEATGPNARQKIHRLIARGRSAPRLAMRNIVRS